MDRAADMPSCNSLSVFLKVLKEDFDGLAARSDSSFDPDEFLSFTKRHNVAGYVYAVLEDAGRLALLPPRLERGLAKAFESQTEKADRLISEIHRLRDRLERVGLDVIFLKGPFLSKRFYGHPRRRYFGDIDLLVRGREDLIRADGVLQEAGYDRLSIPLFGHAAAMRFVYHFGYRSEHAKIDLHWSLRNHFSWDIDYGRLWDTKQSERLGGQEFFVLSPEYVALLLMLSILGDYQKARVRMKFLVDLYKVLWFIGDDSDWAAFLERRRREGVLNINVAMLGLVLDLLDGRGEFPNLTRSLSRHESIGKRHRFAHPLEFLEFSNRIPDKLRNHLWTFRLHEVGMARSIGWRLLVEPFNRAVLRQ
jgi:hypothetical protein